MVIAVMVVDQWMENFSFEYEITGGIEGEHMTGSMHFKGDALDWTIRNHTPSQSVKDLFLRVRDSLGEDFDVILNYEKLRLHIEFEPKTSYGRLD